MTFELLDAKRIEQATLRVVVEALEPATVLLWAGTLEEGLAELLRPVGVGALTDDQERGVLLERDERVDGGGAVLHLGVEVVPELVEHLPDEVQPRPQAGKPFASEKCFRQPGGDLEVLRPGREHLAGELDNQRIVGSLPRRLPFARREIFLLDAGLSDLVVDGVVAEVCATAGGAGRLLLLTFHDLTPLRLVEQTAYRVFVRSLSGAPTVE